MQDRSISNAFVAMCNFADKEKQMRFDNCKLFKRSFTNNGIGYTFNNEKYSEMMKNDFKNSVFFPSMSKPLLMKSSNSKHALRVIIENNAEEVDRYFQKKNQIRFEPTTITVTLHNPKEPADIRSKSFNIPLGHLTTVYITPKAREIEDSAKSLQEYQRNCRLDEVTDSLDIFKIYTKEACMMECKMKYSMNKCGCVPWNYPHNFKNQVILYFIILYM